MIINARDTVDFDGVSSKGASSAAVSAVGCSVKTFHRNVSTKFLSVLTALAVAKSDRSDSPALKRGTFKRFSPLLRGARGDLSKSR